MIPKVIHQTWKDKDLPEILQKIVSYNKSLLSANGYEFKLWTDEDIYNLIDKEYPHLHLIFDSTITGVQRGDIGRLCIVHHCGGIYIDLDILLLQDLDNIIDFDSDKMYISFEPAAQTMKIYKRNDYICNAFFAANKDNRMLGFCINNMQIIFQQYGKSIFQKFDIFGGDYINKIIQKYESFKDTIDIIEERERIFPINDLKFSDLSSSRTDWDLIKNKDYNDNVVMVHYWMHGDFESKNLLKNFEYEDDKDVQDNMYRFFSMLYPQNFQKMK